MPPSSRRRSGWIACWLVAAWLPLLSACQALQDQHRAFRRDMQVVGQEVRSLLSPHETLGVSSRAQEVERGLLSERARHGGY